MRVQVRIDDDAKRLLKRAAALANTSVSAFAVNSALDAAGRLTRERERMVVHLRKGHDLAVLAGRGICSVFL